jgi:hypothetical protein
MMVTDLRKAWRQLRAERAAGAPWPMMRFYACVDLRHVLRRHTGNAHDCTPCYLAIGLRGRT